jgi:hypothetical protein
MPIGPDKNAPDAHDQGGNPGGWGVYRKSPGSGTLNGVTSYTELVVEYGSILNVYGTQALAGS